jgi:hypothetical protein
MYNVAIVNVQQKNCCFNKQKSVFKHLGIFKNLYNLENYIIFVLKIVLFAFSELPSMSLLLYCAFSIALFNHGYCFVINFDNVKEP